MKEYLVSQIILEKQTRPEPNILNNHWDCLIRIVKANSEQEAIGSFVIDTKGIVAVQKLNVNCWLLSETKTI